MHLLPSTLKCISGDGKHVNLFASNQSIENSPQWFGFHLLFSCSNPISQMQHDPMQSAGHSEELPVSLSTGKMHKCIIWGGGQNVHMVYGRVLEAVVLSWWGGGGLHWHLPACCGTAHTSGAGGRQLLSATCLYLWTIVFFTSSQRGETERRGMSQPFQLNYKTNTGPRELGLFHPNWHQHQNPSSSWAVLQNRKQVLKRAWMAEPGNSWKWSVHWARRNPKPNKTA